MGLVWMSWLAWQIELWWRAIYNANWCVLFLCSQSTRREVFLWQKGKEESKGGSCVGRCIVSLFLFGHGTLKHHSGVILWDYCQASPYLQVHWIGMQLEEAVGTREKDNHLSSAWKRGICWRVHRIHYSILYPFVGDQIQSLWISIDNNRWAVILEVRSSWALTSLSSFYSPSW